jgi:DNA-binding transcriptional regulator YdaS (Cro superfamily)
MQHEELVKAIRMIGSQKKLAMELGITRSAINHWLNRGTAIPLDNALSIEVITNGIIKAETLVPHAKTQIISFKRYITQNM